MQDVDKILKLAGKLVKEGLTGVPVTVELGKGNKLQTNRRHDITAMKISFNRLQSINNQWHGTRNMDPPLPNSSLARHFSTIFQSHPLASVNKCVMRHAHYPPLGMCTYPGISHPSCSDLTSALC